VNIYAGTFLIAFATLAYEIALSRLLSITTWYHLAFFAVSTAMLGMTAGAAFIYSRPERFPKERLNQQLTRACLGYSISIPIALILLCLIPLDLKPSSMSFAALIAATVAASLPFFFSGIAITIVLTQLDLPIGKAYGSDLCGAALGCLFVLRGLEFLDAPSFILLCGSIGLLAAFSFGLRGGSRKLRFVILASFILSVPLAFLNTRTFYGIRPMVVKGRVENPSDQLLERSNSFSRVVVYNLDERAPQYFGPSPIAPQEPKLPQHNMVIDGEAFMTMRRFSSPADLEHLRFDVTNVAYYLRPHGPACVIGVGGAKDVQSAIMFGHSPVVGVEVNPIFVDLLQNKFREFAGVANHDGVTLVVDEGRNYLTRSPAKYSTIQISMVDTWASTGAGAFSFTENALYTVEAWQMFFDRLADDGVLTVSRWYSPGNLGETGRAVSLGVAALLRSGVNDPSRHIAMVTSGLVSTLLISKQPFTAEDVATLRRVGYDLRYDVIILPDGPPEHQALRAIVAAKSPSELDRAIANQPLNYQPPTDESPYFFNMLKLSNLGPAFQETPGVLKGNLYATVTLAALIVCLLLLTLLAVIFPTWLGTRRRAREQGPAIVVSGAFYFSLIGAGFMFLEIALIQRLSIFLGHPVYALGIILFTIILSTGIGSLLSDYLRLTHKPWIFLLPIVSAVAILLARFALTALLANMMTATMSQKIAASIIVIFPLGVLLGFFFPAGMKLVKPLVGSETSWYWALNGSFGVLISAVAVFVSIYLSISTNFYLAAVCYAGLAVFASRLVHSGERPIRSTKPHEATLNGSLSSSHFV
jgi:hypothetical protein